MLAPIETDDDLLHLSTIFIVDDDPGVREALASVGELLHHPVSAFSSADKFLASYDPNQPGCLILDIQLVGMTGLELQRELVHSGIMLPIIMISGHADVRIAVEVMRLGALTLLEKPFRLDELTTHIRRAMELDHRRRASLTNQARKASRLAQLTHKEREVLDLVASGHTNKEIADLLQLSIRAIEDRRSRLMKKLGAQSVVQLVQLLT